MSSRSHLKRSAVALGIPLDSLEVRLTVAKLGVIVLYHDESRRSYESMIKSFNGSVS